MSIFQSLSHWNRRRLQRRKFDKISQQAWSYAHWIDANERLSDDLQRQLAREGLNPGQPVSVLMLLSSQQQDDGVGTLQSIGAQWHKDVEICLACEGPPNGALARELVAHRASGMQIKVVDATQQGEAEQMARLLELATGDLVMRLLPGDQLPRYALSAFVKAFDRWPSAQWVYADEDTLKPDGTREDPWFKPDWNELLFLAQDHASNAVMVRRDLILQAGGYLPSVAGAVQRDLLLRCLSRLNRDHIRHVPLVLIHTRKVQADVSASRQAVTAYFERMEVSVDVQVDGPDLHAAYRLPAALPKVTVLILTRDRPQLLDRCVRSVIEQTHYASLEFLIVDNGTVDPKALKLLEELAEDPRVTLVRDDSPFNFSALNNRAAQVAQGDFLCLLNNDIEVLNPEWLSEMMAVALQPGIGAVGARLWFPDGRLQHAGITLGIGGAAGHPFRLQRREDPHYRRRPNVAHELSAVTAACLVTPRSLYAELGGMDEKAFQVAFNDVDYCLKVRRAGHRIALVPRAELIHHESVSRGYEDTDEKKRRFMVERQNLITRWSHWLSSDPAYNPNLTVDDDSYGVAKFSRLTPGMWFLGEHGAWGSGHR
jgi:O-antigen biosynthesis protein